jgi:hypothetical protein
MPSRWTMVGVPVVTRPADEAVSTDRWTTACCSEAACCCVTAPCWMVWVSSWAISSRPSELSGQTLRVAVFEAATKYGDRGSRLHRLCIRCSFSRGSYCCFLSHGTIHPSRSSSFLLQLLSYALHYIVIGHYPEALFQGRQGGVAHDVGNGPAGEFIPSRDLSQIGIT